MSLTIVIGYKPLAMELHTHIQAVCSLSRYSLSFKKCPKYWLSKHRDIAAAKRFLQQAIEKRGVPQKITLDGYAASYKAVAALQQKQVLPADLVVRTNRYLNNIIEQDHRRVKQRVRPMLGFKRFAHAVITISGIELVHQMKKGQFDTSALCAPQARMPQVWEAVLAA